ncbi:MAG: ABC transporter permease [Coriobacteriia bacterium]|nr:ABC transporter permease [Coriobacteriia bacterium]MCL2870511.1 ABC transporter permease [Coriobacteriia bacterium]
MLELMKIELKKFNLIAHLIQLAIASVTLLALINLIAIGEAYPITTIELSLLCLLTFVIWQGVLIAKFIVSEFRDKTIQLLFTYPVDRKKLILSKLVIVNGIIYVSMLATLLFLHGTLTALNFMTILDYSASLQQLGVTALMFIAFLMVGMIALFAGMLKKSTIATIVTSVVLVLVFGGSMGEGSLMEAVPVVLVFGAIGALFTFLSIKDLGKKDLLV